ncbi:hypothetical protein M153_78410001, partial [Pseudoloma neurophilia]
TEKNIIINKKKNSLGQNQIKYLGFVISKEGYHTDPDRLEDFKQWSKPKTRLQLQNYLVK